MTSSRMTMDLRHRNFPLILLAFLTLSALIASCQEKHPSLTTTPVVAQSQPSSQPTAPPELAKARELGFSFPVALNGRSKEQVAAGSASCIACHNPDAHTMHVASVNVSCTDCHGGHADISIPPAVTQRGRADAEYQRLQHAAHVAPTLKDFWPPAANPQIPFAKT